MEETNADWWTGRFNGKQGLLPSNHVEKLASGAPPTPARTILAPPPQYDQSATAPAPREKAPYKSFGAAHHGADRPPPAGSGTVNSVGLQEAPGQDKKKGKYGSLGNTVGFCVGCPTMKSNRIYCRWHTLLRAVLASAQVCIICYALLLG